MKRFLTSLKSSASLTFTRCLIPRTTRYSASGRLHLEEDALKTPEVVEVSLPSNTRHLHALRVLTSSLAESMGFPRNEAENTALAVEEALTNVMEHSYHGDPTRR